MLLRSLCLSVRRDRPVTDGRFVALDADHEHPTRQALCLKGKVAPEIVYHPKRLLRSVNST